MTTPPAPPSGSPRRLPSSAASRYDAVSKTTSDAVPTGADGHDVGGILSETKPPRPTPVGRAWKTWALELLLAGALYFGIRAWQTRHILDGPAPPVAGVTLDGNSVSLESLRGQPVLLYFWATWCGACKMQQANIDTVAKDAAIITVAAQSGEAAAVREELKVRGLAWPVLNDPDGTLAAAYGVHAYPTTFFISPEGDISTVEVGYTTTPGLRLRLWWAGL